MKSYKLLSILLAFCYFLNKPAIAQNVEVNLLPNFNEISFKDLDTFREGGTIGTEFNELVGRDISRQFNAGDRVEDVLQLGDLEASLAPQEFTLNDINDRLLEQPNDFSILPLSEFSLLEEQTLENLVDAIPGLGQEQAADIEPIKALLEQEGFRTDTNLDTLVIDQSIADLELSSIDLENFSVDSIPNLTDTQLGSFENFEQSAISEVPGLSQVPLGDFPNGIPLAGTFIARIDFVWGGAESERNRTISGSYVEGFQVPCDLNCEYLELDDIENIGSTIQLPFEGKQWIAGREHWVKGGTGCFSGLREPTGIHPFGPTFKLVLWRTDETTDTAQIVMFFNIKTQCGETPYVIGPIPFPLGFVRVNDYVFIGVGG
ncbi:hypothetical protein I4641_02490 [Waterburya agarophytonicola K14]|uniref:Uncharacterized protein n=1 Tax=Waterburya agarophytonicola KI4 TaxID=2874699 RepID=A0A964BQ41_9CYAN|nr:hypothetical protein [Waterburya agarophytonicola]MCC0175850.1 hypothetical protein [Waterburya agarophytonicola KI4]